MILPHWESLISEYGYGLMAIGALIEGETFLIMGGMSAAKGLLHIPGLITLAVIGSMIHDSIFYLFGRYALSKWIHKIPKIQPKLQKVEKMIIKYDIWLIIGFRFAYGLRTIIPLALGSSGVPKRTFYFFGFIGALLWSCIFIIGGYYFGTFLIELSKKYDIHTLSFRAILIIIFALAAVGAVYFILRKRKKKREALK